MQPARRASTPRKVPRESARTSMHGVFCLNEFNVRQHSIGYIDDRSQFQVHTDERTNGHSAQSSLVVTHPSTNRGRRALTTVNESLS